MKSASEHFLLARTYLSGTPFFYKYLLVCLTPYQRGIHDINRPFAFRSNPGFIFHDSAGFETGDERQLQEVLSFIEKKAKSTNVDDQLHAIWSVSLFRLMYWSLMVHSCGERFCIVLNGARPLFPLETAFFETARAGKGLSISPSYKSQINILQYPSSRSLPSSMI